MYSWWKDMFDLYQSKIVAKESALNKKGKIEKSRVTR
jgi:hypothetical protein